MEQPHSSIHEPPTFFVSHPNDATYSDAFPKAMDKSDSLLPTSGQGSNIHGRVTSAISYPTTPSHPNTVQGFPPNHAPAIDIQVASPSTSASFWQRSIHSQVRLTSYSGSCQSLHFEPIVRRCKLWRAISIGRRSDIHPDFDPARLLGIVLDDEREDRIAFGSDVISRHHCQLWLGRSGQLWIRDTKSTWGTFVNHVRLSLAKQESRPFPLKNGDVIQLGVNRRCGAETMHQCVKFTIDMSFEEAPSSSSAGLRFLKQLLKGSSESSKEKMSSPVASPSTDGSHLVEQEKAAGLADDCCICLSPMTINGALFSAPCSHAFHYKCIRPVIEQQYPSFSCPLCRSFVNLDEDVEGDAVPRTSLANRSPS
ncbi:hypothetical protein FRC03_001086 [Tulasnella sp. 419]|nr:hypothetical protein FRC03_001086 [Tulasnella sp. 419]